MFVRFLFDLVDFGVGFYGGLIVCVVLKRSVAHFVGGLI